MSPSATTLKSVIYSLLLHVAALILLIVSIEFAPHDVFRQPQPVSIVNAVAVDEKQVQAELDRLQEIERKKAEEEKRRQEDLQKKLTEIERKTAEAEKQRKAEEKRLAELAKQKEQEQKQREAEQKKLAEVKRQKEELEKQQKQEEERKRKEEQEKKHQEAEEALKRQLAEEQQRLDEARLRQEQGIVNEFVARIRYAIQQEFNTAGLPSGLSCILEIRMIPGGEVVEARIAKSSGNGIFDRRAEVAVNKAAPLPVPDDPRIFERMRQIRLTFAPDI